MRLAAALDAIVASQPNSPASDLKPGDVWCCIPVYNNAATIQDVAQNCRKYLENVVVIDDGSTDINIAATLAEFDITVLVHTENLGKGAALLTGFQYIYEQGGKYAITLDGDDQHFPSDIPAFLEHLHPHTLILGKRDRIEGEMPVTSRFGREFSDFWIELETGTKTSDTQSGFRAYPLDAINQLRLSSRHYNFEVEAVTRALWAGLAVRDVPIGVWYPPASERVSSFDHRKDNFRLARLHAKLALRQLIPWPHRKIVNAQSTVKEVQKASWWKRNASPTGLALAAALALLLPLMHGGWGALAMLYIVWRWHLNLLASLIAALAGCAIYLQHAMVMKVGQWMLSVDASSSLTWFVGSHVVGPAAALVTGLVVYKIARKCQPLQDEAAVETEDASHASQAGQRDA